MVIEDNMEFCSIILHVVFSYSTRILCEILILLGYLLVTVKWLNEFIHLIFLGHIIRK